ncbi:hypothetical protein U1Q18_002599 [Sarracenia purpurea var. burkii]
MKGSKAKCRSSPCLGSGRRCWVGSNEKAKSTDKGKEQSQMTKVDEFTDELLVAYGAIQSLEAELRGLQREVDMLKTPLDGTESHRHARDDEMC